MPDPVPGTWSYIFSFESGTGYRITFGIYLYRIWYWVPDPVKYSCHLICCRVQDTAFYIFYWIRYRVPGFMPDPALGTGFNARSGTSYWILCFFQYQILYRVPEHTQYLSIPDLIPGTRSCWVFYLLDLLSGTRSCILHFLLDPELGTGLNARSDNGYQSCQVCFFTGYVVGFQILCVIYYGSGTGYRPWCRVRYWVPDLVPDPVLGTRSYILSSIRSATGYQITIGIYIYGIWYLVPDPVRYSFYRICCQEPDPVVLYFWIRYWVPDLMPDPVLGTWLWARSGTGYPILCFG